MYDPKTREWLPVAGVTSILRASRQLYYEGCQTRYGCNKFSFDTTGTLCDFLEAIGDKRASLRYITIEPKGYMPRKACKAFELLQSARSLRHIEVHHLDLCGGRGKYESAIIRPHSPSEIVDHASALLKMLKRSYEAQNVNADVQDVLVLTELRDCGEVEYILPGAVHPVASHSRLMGRPGDIWWHKQCNCVYSQAETNHQRLAAEMKQEAVKQLGLDRVSRRGRRMRELAK